MEGRRMERRGAKRNPLFTIFVALFIAALALLVVAIIMGVKLRAANKQLAIAEMKIAQYEQQEAKQPEREEPDIGGIPGDDIVATDPTEPEQTAEPEKTEVKVGWLDLTGHKEVQVAPKSVFDKYYTHYAAEGVNLRGGPGTNYDRIKLVDLGTEVKAAAKDGDWTFVSVGSKFGWMKSEYLSTAKPEVKKTEPAKEETKPAEQKPAEQKPAEQQPVEEIVASPGQIGP